MKDIIVLTLVCGALFLFVKRIAKMKHQRESNLSVFEHPSTFEKQGIEMVSDYSADTRGLETKDGKERESVAGLFPEDDPVED